MAAIGGMPGDSTARVELEAYGSIPPTRRRWSDTDRELVAQALFEFGRYDSERPWPWWVEHHPRMAQHARDRAAAVLDALTAAGWRRHGKVLGYVVDGKRYAPDMVVVYEEAPDAR